MKFLHCLRLDASDDAVYPRTAHAGEWVVPGTFAFTFSERDPGTLQGGEREAFRRGFLGLESFGWTTLAAVVAMTDTERRQALERLARHFLERYGAPDLDAAMAQAREEVDYTRSLCDLPLNTILSLQRRLTAEGVVEDFRIHSPRQAADWEHGQVFRMVPEAGRQ